MGQGTAGYAGKDMFTGMSQGMKRQRKKGYLIKPSETQEKAWKEEQPEGWEGQVWRGRVCNREAVRGWGAGGGSASSTLASTSAIGQKGPRHRPGRSGLATLHDTSFNFFTS